MKGFHLFNIIRTALALLLSFVLNTVSFSQNLFEETELMYNNSFNKLSQIINDDGSFLNAVLTTEGAYNNDTSFFTETKNAISLLGEYVNYFYPKISCKGYYFKDSTEYKLNNCVFNVITDTTYLQIDTLSFVYLPFTYSFTDPFGQKDWSNNFVTKLLATHEGNCHNLAYLYKILADEVGAKCWLALAPGHIYIKNYSEKIGWYNTELTSGTFPTDAWVMVSGYVNPQAMKSGMYMDTLSNRQAIALCVLDLAKGYEFQTHNYYDGFILKCCDLVLQYHPVNPIALLLKAETLKKVFIKEQKDKYPKPTTTFTLMQEAYAALAKLGYREMPEEMYKRWLIEMTEEKNIYQNKQLQEK